MDAWHLLHPQGGSLSQTKKVETSVSTLECRASATICFFCTTCFELSCFSCRGQTICWRGSVVSLIDCCWVQYFPLCVVHRLNPKTGELKGGFTLPACREGAGETRFINSSWHNGVLWILMHCYPPSSWCCWELSTSKKIPSANVFIAHKQVFNIFSWLLCNIWMERCKSCKVKGDDLGGRCYAIT